MTHIFFSVAQVIYHLHIYGGGDMLLYHAVGEYISRLISEDPRLIPDLFDLIGKGRNNQFAWIQGAGTSTGVMFGLSALVSLFVGDSILSKCLVFSLASFVGKLALYFGLKTQLSPRYHPRAMVAALLIPSVVFWSSGIIKESVAMTGLGFMFYGLSSLIRHRKPNPYFLVFLSIGMLLTFITKSYVLVVICIAGLGWFLADHFNRNARLTLRLWHLVLISSVAVLAMLGMGRLFPEYSLEEVAQETATLQEAYRRQEGGSSFQVQAVSKEQGIRGQIANLPIAIVSTLFRPFFFESRNPAMFVNSLETTLILWLLLLTLHRRGVRPTFQTIISNPFLLFCFGYVLIFAVALGLAATNLGTLSRYRIPMVPLFWVLVLLLVPIKSVQPPTNSKRLR
ncbi:hypothetical protein FRD01_15975 [Microvenator marinus]|uniref:Glycosyltransferase RgtA/B/C/D-like domain-containing protein n=1 Tax=Microvenator marinus TaxID=2600177 RepID=A0A5B8XT36_9DELT|nr:hypothetical protein [Microvenator marinus]QED28705.1 hypothetical protein FRD01_15975 [Microvenator marinus]